MIHLVTDLLDPAMGSEFQVANKALHALMRHGANEVQLWTCLRAGNEARIRAWLEYHGYAHRVRLHCAVMPRADADGHHVRRLDLMLDLLHLYRRVRKARAQGDIVWKCGQSNWLFHLLFMVVCRADALGPISGFEQPPWRAIPHAPGALKARYLMNGLLARLAGWLFRVLSRIRPGLWVLPATAADLAALLPRASGRTQPVSEVSVEELPSRTTRAVLHDRCTQDKGVDVLWAGALIDRKNPLLALDVISRVLADDANLRALMIGDGPLQPKLRQQWGCLPPDVRDRVCLESAKSRADFVDVLAASRALLVTSSREVNSVLVFEALALGRVVVSTAVSGMRQSVGQCGELYDPCGPEVITQAAAALRRGLARGPRTDPAAWLRDMASREEAVLQRMVREWVR